MNCIPLRWLVPETRICSRRTKGLEDIFACPLFHLSSLSFQGSCTFLPFPGKIICYLQVDGQMIDLPPHLTVLPFPPISITCLPLPSVSCPTISSLSLNKFWLCASCRTQKPERNCFFSGWTTKALPSLH